MKTLLPYLHAPLHLRPNAVVYIRRDDCCNELVIGHLDRQSSWNITVSLLMNWKKWKPNLPKSNPAPSAKRSFK
jgi:hypothetical protein